VQPLSAVRKVSGMNENLMEILARDIVGALPPHKKEMYQSVVRLEDELARRASTADELMRLLIQHAPHRQAADHFGLPFGEFMVEREIEKEIERQLNRKLEKVKWVDCTDVMMHGGEPGPTDAKYFYFSVGWGSVSR
jgi:hypothetical protein